MKTGFRVEEGDLTGLVLTLGKGKEWLIGRDPDRCALLLEDADIDRVQFKCLKVDNQYFLENLSESHPVTINGEILVELYCLAPGDLITIGGTVLSFFQEKAQTGGILFARDDEESRVLTAEEQELERNLDSLSGDEEDDSEQDDNLDQEVTDSPSEEESPFTEEATFKGGGEAAFSESAEEPSPDQEVLLEGEDEAPIDAEPPSDLSEEDQVDESLDDIIEEEISAPSEERSAEPSPMSMFEEGEEFHLDLTPTSRFILKVIAGPNTGAEFAIDPEKTYLIGTDTTTCDIIFHDLSVSREHAKLLVHADGSTTIEDLGSRNGVVIDQKRIKEPTLISANSIVSIGTTSFFLIDKEAPQETIMTPIIEPAPREDEDHGEYEEEEEEQEKEREEAPQPARLSGAFILSFIIIGIIGLLGYGLFSLSQSREIVPEKHEKDFALEVHEALKDFPGVRYTYNRATRQLFLVGHVSNSVEYSEMHYNLQGLSFIRGIQNNVVNDEAVWQEMNLLLVKHPDFKGVSMHSPAPGVFVLGGYLKTDAQASALMDYVNINFNYLNLLENRVIVEQTIGEEIAINLTQKGFASVTSVFANGELSLTGYIGAGQVQEFEKFVQQTEAMPGVRHVQNYVVVVKPEQQVVDLSMRYPGRYVVTGYSKHGDVNINVVINGKILMRGDLIDEMQITSIQPHTIFLEKDGLKYKIEYNK